MSWACRNLRMQVMISDNPRKRAKQSCSLSWEKVLSVTSKRESRAEGVGKWRNATLMYRVVEITASTQRMFSCHCKCFPVISGMYYTPLNAAINQIYFIRVLQYFLLEIVPCIFRRKDTNIVLRTFHAFSNTMASLFADLWDFCENHYMIGNWIKILWISSLLNRHVPKLYSWKKTWTPEKNINKDVILFDTLHLLTLHYCDIPQVVFTQDIWGF